MATKTTTAKATPAKTPAKAAAPAKQAPKAKTADSRGTHKGAGFCRRVVNGKFHNAPVPADKPNWTWCRSCVDEHAAAKRAERKAGEHAKASTKRATSPRLPGAKATATRKPAKNSGGATRTTTPPVRSMGSGAVARVSRIPSAPEGYAPVSALIAPDS